MFRRAFLGLGSAAVACLVLGPISRKRDIFIWESDHAPSRYYRNYDNRPWKHVPPESHLDDPSPATICVGFCDGRFRFDYISVVKPIEPHPGIISSYSGRRPPLPVKLDVLGFRYRAGRMTPYRSDIIPFYAGELIVPVWLLVALFGSYPMLAFIRGPHRRYRRRKKGLCLKCGYNLTGNVSGVCPECGERI